MKHENVLEMVYEPGRLLQAWQQVKHHAGAAGIDEMTVDEFESKADKLLEFIHARLKTGIYRFKPTRRVLIPKEGFSQARKIGISAVMDRVVRQSINSVFEEIFGSDFTASNFRFLKYKSQHQAIKHVQPIAEEGNEWCASIDLHALLDEIPHSLIVKHIRRKIADERLVTLIKGALRAGVIVNGVYEKTIKGCPRETPLSPMISNIVLHELNYKLERRHHQSCRWDG